MKKREPTEAAKTVALFREKPFLTEYVSPDKVLSSKVQRAGADLLREKAGYSRGLRTRLILLDLDGKRVYEAGLKVFFNHDYIPVSLWNPRSWFQAPQRKEKIFPESVDSALEKCAKSYYVHYVLKITGTDDDYAESILVLYKAPSNMTLTQSIEADIRRAQEELNDQLTVMDN